MKKRVRFAIPFAVLVVVSPALAQDASSHCGGDRHAQVDARGDHVMGFDHDKSTHHFRLTPSGGAIDVSANDPADTKTRDAVREHLAHIATKFAAGDFEAPMLIHDQVPPGVPVMKRNRNKIDWKYEDTEAGGRIVIATKDSEVLAAVHEFLRFQIEDHRTGDPTEVRTTP
jgi:hypothetical protein